MRLRKLTTLYSLIIIFGNTMMQLTKRENKLLLRKKRYLNFPEGSNFVMTLSMIKSLVRSPKGTNMLGECDVPFSLPSDTRIFKGHKDVYSRQRRDIFNQMATALNGYGYNGPSCVRRMICEAQVFISLGEADLLRDLFSVLFRKSDALDSEYFNYCRNESFIDCDVSVLNYILGALLEK